MSAEALGRRLVACKGFRWMPGMKSLHGWMCYDRTSEDLEAVEIDSGEIDSSFIAGPQGVEPGRAYSFDDPDTLGLPDTNDPATLGCVLALVREAWGDPTAHVVSVTAIADPPVAIEWYVNGADKILHALECPTEAEALVAALEAAP